MAFDTNSALEILPVCSCLSTGDIFNALARPTLQTKEGIRKFYMAFIIARTIAHVALLKQQDALNPDINLCLDGWNQLFVRSLGVHLRLQQIQHLWTILVPLLEYGRCNVLQNHLHLRPVQAYSCFAPVLFP